MIIFFAAAGLQQAENVTAALYENNLEHLKKLEPLDLQSVFEGATFTELLLEPGTTILEAAVKAGCFKTKCTLFCFCFCFVDFILFFFY